jgi:hypothetical protein
MGFSSLRLIAVWFPVISPVYTQAILPVAVFLSFFFVRFHMLIIAENHPANNG